MTCVIGLLLTAGCQQAGTQRIVGPDGSVMLHVHCGKDQGTCFALAGEQCPYGYDIRPVFESDAGNFLVSCRAPLAVAQAPYAAQPAPAGPYATQPPPHYASPRPNGWPPPPEPATPAEPWPRPELNSTSPSQANAGEPQQPSKPRPMPPAFEDLGY